MRARSLFFLFVIATFGACSDEPAEVADQPGAAPATIAEPEPVVDATLAVRLGIVFNDADPQLMAGAQLVRGTLRVGDRVELVNSAGGRSRVRIDEIKDDASSERVLAATAPAGVFLIFTADTKGAVGAEQVLIANGSFADYASAKAFVDAQAEEIVAP